MPRAPFGGRACLVLACLALLSCGDGEPTHLALRPGLSLASGVKGGEARSFTFELRRDQYLELRVSQDFLDVELTLQAPDGRRGAPLDTTTPVPLPEVLRVVAPLDGRFVLTIDPDEESSGSFQLEVTALRPASARDRLVAEGQAVLAEAEGLRRQEREADELRALPLYEKAVRLFAQAGDHEWEGYARVQWARVLQGLHRKHEAAEVLRAALALPPAAQMPGVRVRATTLLGDLAYDLRANAEAEAMDLEALLLWRQLGKTGWQAELINRLGILALDRGELAKAESLFLEALRLSESVGDLKKVSLVTGNLAKVYVMAGEPQPALDRAEQALDRAPEDMGPEGRSQLLTVRGEALSELGRREESQQAFAEAVRLAGEGEPTVLAQLERRLARLAYDEGSYDEAATRFEKALDILTAVQDRQSVVATRQDLAWSELKRGRLDVAERLFLETAAEAGTMENRWIQPAILAGRARLERTRGNLQAALALALQALDDVEALRLEVGRSDLKRSVFATHQSYFDLAADLTIELHDRTGDPALLAQAFEISERSRARLLLELVATSRVQGDAELRKAEAGAAEALSRSEERLKALRMAGEPPSVIEEAERAVRRAVGELRRAKGEAGGAGLEAAPLSLGDIQRWIDPETVLLELDLGEDVSYLWTVSRDRLSVRRLPPRRELEKLARKAVGALSAQGYSAVSVQSRQALETASRLLIGEDATALGARRWLLVLDGALHGLPVGALPDPRDLGAPLLVAHKIAYAPSASVAVRLAERERREKPRKELAVLADPVYETPKLGEGLFQLKRLVHSDTEARHILSLVPAASRLDARQLVATKDRVLSGELADYRLLHFAVHGLPNEEHPELSGLALSLFDAQGRPRDGILFAHEIARLHLPADLAVLSACHSGRGAAVLGEGVVGLVDAFFTAGTARVVASSWAVSDQATAELMQLLYDGLLRQNLSPARALQQAQIALARKDPWRRPYYWAAFTLQGGF